MTRLRFAALLTICLQAAPALAGQLSLTWQDLSTSETSVEVERAPAATGPFALLATLPTGATTYVDTGLAENAAWCYRVRNRNAIGTSGYSNTACGTTPLLPVTVATATATPRQVAIMWADPSAAETGFLIARGPSIAGPFSMLATVPAGSTGYVDTGLSDGTAYCYQVITIAGSVTAAPSPPACATTPLNAPGQLQVIISLSGPGAGGTVTSQPPLAGIACPSLCAATFPAGSIVTLLAAPKRNGSRFGGWSGAGCSGTAPYCNVTMPSADALVGAVFYRGDIVGGERP